MSKYKITIDDRNYTEFKFFEINNYNEVDLDIDPIEYKLFNGDVFHYNDNIFTLSHSIVQSMDNIPGVLIVSGDILGKKGGRWMYKCIPDDKRLPCFVIPLGEKTKNNFLTVKYNRYITFKYNKWDKKHPEGYIQNNLGTVNELNPYYEYQLYCKCLNHSIQKFTSDCKENIRDNIVEDIFNVNNIINRTNEYVFTMDSPNTLEFDDAYSIHEFEDYTKLSIYITNVAIILDNLNLWESFTDRISTIYLPDKKRPMLPTILSSSLCSLIKKQKRIVYGMDIIFNGSTINISFNQYLIKVTNNFYHDTDLSNNVYYNLLKKYVNILHKKHNFSKILSSAEDIVSYLMMFMNYQCSTKFINYNSGIFRSSSISNVHESIPDEIVQFIQILNSSSGIYTTEVCKPHELLKFDSYLHITSPIRRIVDLLNSIILLSNEKIYKFTPKAFEFYDKWINQLDYINQTSKTIRKIQFDCNLLNKFYFDENISEKTFEGYIFDKLYRNDGLIQYSVYIPSIKMSARLTIKNEYDNFTKHSFSIHIIKNTDKFKKKVRLHIKDNEE